MAKPAFYQRFHWRSPDLLYVVDALLRFLTQSDEMNLQAAIGIRIRTLRSERGLSQEEFADICGIHRSHMGEIERGEKDVTISTLQKISRGLNIHLSVLLEDVA